MSTFYVDDGFLLYRDPESGSWFDDKNPGSADLEFYAGVDGLPIDCDGVTLWGHIVD